MVTFAALIFLSTLWIRFFAKRFPFWDRINHFLVGLVAGILSYAILFLAYLKLFQV